MFKFLLNFILAYAVEQMLWGKYVEAQRWVNRARLEGKYYILQGLTLRQGYPLKLTTKDRGLIRNCTFKSEQNWRPAARRFCIKVTGMDMPNLYMEETR